MQATQTFNEPEWLRLLFSLNDTHAWLQEMERSLLYQLPIDEKSKPCRKTYRLPVTSLAHQLEKHYYKISRHPGCSKFTIRRSGYCTLYPGSFSHRAGTYSRLS